MNIAINLLQFVVGGSGGVETYVKELISKIGSEEKYKNINLYILMMPEDEIFFTEGKNIKIIRIKKLSRPETLIYRILRKINKNLDYETKKIKKIIEKYKIDIIHYPFSVITNFNINIPTVLSVMDIQQEFYPEFFSEKDLIARKNSYKISCEKADKIITISDFTRKTIIDKYKINPNKLKTAHLGSEVTTELKAVKGLPKEFMYYPAGMWPHKNHKNLFKAMKILKKEYNFSPNLVLTGIKVKNEKDIKKIISRFSLSKNITILGYLSHNEISYIYSKAHFLVFPSLFEGFGMPPLEAMGAGLPVACSNVTSLPEIVGKAALMFNPKKPKEIAKAIYKLWLDGKTRKDLIKKGLEQAKIFSWDNTIRNNVKVYEEVYKKSKG